MIFLHQFEKDFVTLPHRKIIYFFFRQPFQNSFPTVGEPSFEFVCGIEEHVLRRIFVCGKCHYSSQAVGCKLQSCFFHGFPEKAFLRGLSFLEVASYSYPFIPVYVVFFFYSVHHEVRVFVLYIAKCRHRASIHSFLLFVINLYEPIHISHGICGYLILLIIFNYYYYLYFSFFIKLI